MSPGRFAFGAFGEGSPVGEAGLFGLNSGDRVGGDEVVDGVVFRVGEAEGEGGGKADDLLGAAAADDGGSDGGVVEGPGDGDDAGFDTVGEPISRRSSTRRRLRERRGSLNSTPRRRQSSAGMAATRSADMRPARSPLTMGE